MNEPTPISDVMKEIIPQMVTLRQASDITGLSYDHLRKLCLADRIVYIRAGSKYLLNFPRLIEYLNTGDGGTENEN